MGRERPEMDVENELANDRNRQTEESVVEWEDHGGKRCDKGWEGSLSDSLGEIEQTTPGILLLLLPVRIRNDVDVMGLLGSTGNLPHPEWTSRIASVMSVGSPRSNNTSGTANLPVLHAF